MKTILVATDFSPASLNAANYAADMALAIHADLLLLHVYHVPVTYGEVPVSFNADDLREDAEKDMTAFKKLLEAKAGNGLNINTMVMLGIFFPELKKICDNIHPYAVVMGSQGTTSAERFFFGSHTVFAMKNLQWPLITVPVGVKYSAVKKIGLACDFNKVVDTTPVNEIKMLVKEFNAELYVLNTGKREVFDPEIVFESGLLQEMLIDLKPQYHFISSENTDQGIIDFADKHEIDLLLVLPKRHGLLEKMIHKSNTKKLVLRSHIPVMALH
ncbi:MAG TPA: universal stress protein [Ferruginibacter sp.]|nr:universal stress protein [Ferruginibacter sp.]